MHLHLRRRAGERCGRCARLANRPQRGRTPFVPRGRRCRRMPQAGLGGQTPLCGILAGKAAGVEDFTAAAWLGVA
jgi:hypothetical protein